MSDLKQILAGTVEDIIKTLEPLTVDQLTELKALEAADKNRKGVLTAIEAALAALAAAVSTDGEVTEPAPIVDEADTTVGTSVTETSDTADVAADPVELQATELAIETPVVEAPAIDPEHVYFVDEAVADDMPAEDEPVTGEAPAATGSVIDPEHVYFVDEAVTDDMPAEDEPVTGEAPAATGSVIDMAHFAVDTDLRAGTSIDQNRIDFNDPRAEGREVVEAALAAQIEG